ncbi:MAG: hypothetical protein ACM3L6_01965, partial [Deltaproteobacteria bacterium]
VKNLEAYLEMARSRDIFKIGAVPRSENQAAPASPEDRGAKEREEAILGKFHLVGISWSEDPDAMVENTAENKTYFVKRGHVIDGVRVEAIYKDYVVLSLDGKEVELR